MLFNGRFRVSKVSSRFVAAVLLIVLLSFALPQNQTRALARQSTSSEQISPGTLLLASEKLGDPNFAESVVLILQHDNDTGTLGLIINRRTEVPLSRVFPKIEHASSDPVYMGGPVATSSGQALLRRPNKTEDIKHVLGDIYVTGKKETIEQSVRSRAESSQFRLYLGYAGWAPGQLESEIQLGAWSVLKASAPIVFDHDPDSLWSRLKHESEMQIARGVRLSKCGARLYVIQNAHGFTANGVTQNLTDLRGCNRVPLYPVYQSRWSILPTL